MKITGFGCDLMPQISFVNLLIVAAVAVLAPLLLGYLPRLRLPAVVVERSWSRARPLSPRLGAHRPTGKDTGHPWAGLLVVFGRAGDRLAYVARSCFTSRPSGLWAHTRAGHSGRRWAWGSGLDEVAAPRRDRVVSDFARTCGAGTQRRREGGGLHWANHHRLGYPWRTSLPSCC